MGTGPFAVPSCRRLLAAGHDIPLVVVRPPAAAAGKKSLPTPVQSWAADASLPIFHPASINTEDSLATLRGVAADLFFVCDYGQILSRDCLRAARLGGINLHGSLLPRHRGAAPVQWTLLAGDPLAGVSVIHMTPGLDAGPVIATRSLEIAPDENAEELEQRLSAVGCDATLEAVERLSAWDGVIQLGIDQDKDSATKAPRLSKADGRLDFSRSATELVRRVRGYQPWPGAYGQLIFSESKQISLHLRAARSLHDTSAESSKPIGSAWSATATQLNLDGDQWLAPWDKLLVVQTGDGCLLVSKVQPAGKRLMSADEFLRGHPLPSSAHFNLVGFHPAAP